MAYTVVGYTFGTMDSVAFHTGLVRAGLLDLIPKMSILTIGSEDIETLESRFGERFANFVLLDDVAIEACKATGFSLAPPGAILGQIDSEELRSPLPLFPASQR
jgi:hypothetical protein